MVARVGHRSAASHGLEVAALVAKLVRAQVRLLDFRLWAGITSASGVPAAAAARSRAR